MSGMKNEISAAENSSIQKCSEFPSDFNRRLVRNGRLSCPRRYVIVLMFFFLLLIETWRTLNITFTLTHVIFLGEDAHDTYPSIGNWTITEVENYQTVAIIAELFAHMPGALLIFTFSSYKFLIISTLATSILHMLTPVAFSHHSSSLLVVLLAQNIIAAPIYTAIMSTWKDWAAPSERTKFMIFSLYGWFIGSVATTFYSFLYPYLIHGESYYLSGIAGLIWTLFWYNLVSDTPQNDPLISEEELIYLEGNIPSDLQTKIKVKDVPWIAIMKSKQVLLLCLIFFKVACSFYTSVLGGIIFLFYLDLEGALYLLISFLTTFSVILPCNAILADFLLKKFRGRTLLIRKIFLCGGFFLQSVFMLGIVAESMFTKAIFYLISYIIFAMSTPGFITLPLDLSPRYVSLIAGIIFTFFTLGNICITEFAERTLKFFHIHTVSYILLIDGCLSITSAVLFALMGDNEEQIWSFTVPPSRRNTGYQSYPKPDDEDDLNLVTENV